MPEYVREVRFLHRNSLLDADAVVTASGQQADWPVRFLQSPDRGAVYRSPIGWGLARGLNVAVPFAEDVWLRVARIAEGVYATGDALATATATAMNAAPIYPPSADAVNIRHWWRPEDLADQYADGEAVSGWRDCWAGQVLGQATAGLRPTYRANIVQGLGVLDFAGAQYLDSSAALSTMIGAQAACIMVVFRLDAALASTAMLAASSNGSYVELYHSSGNLTARNQDAGGADLASKACSLGAWHVAMWGHDATNVHVAVDNALTASLASTASGATTSLAGTLRLGANSAGGQQLLGRIAEVIVYASWPSEAARRRLDHYVSSRYGVTVGSTAGWANTYAATYDGPTHKFTLTRSAGAASWSPAFDSGSNPLLLAESAGPDLGFRAAQSALTAYTSDTAVYSGQACVDVDLGPAECDIDIVVGLNDAVPVIDALGGYSTALLAPGHYSDPYALAAAVQVALASLGGSWTVAWDPDPNKLRVTNGAGSTRTLGWGTSPDATRSAGPMLGWPDRTDVPISSGASTLAPRQVWGWNPTMAAAVLDHNAGFGGAVRLLASQRPLRAAIAAAQYGAAQLELVGDSRLRIGWQAPALGRRYVRVVLDFGSASKDGYSAAAVLYVGPYLTLDTAPAEGWEFWQESLSVTQRTDFGAVYQERRPDAWRYRAELTGQTPLDRARLLDLQQTVGLGTPFLFAEDGLDPERQYTHTHYMVLAEPFRFTAYAGGGRDGERWKATLALVEDLA